MGNLTYNKVTFPLPSFLSQLFVLVWWSCIDSPCRGTAHMKQKSFLCFFFAFFPLVFHFSTHFNTRGFLHQCAMVIENWRQECFQISRCMKIILEKNPSGGSAMHTDLCGASPSSHYSNFLLPFYFATVAFKN